MKHKWAVAVALGLFLVLNACVATKGKSNNPNLRKDNFNLLLGACQTAEDSVAIQELDAFFKILDPEFKGSLRKISDLEIFIQQIEKYKKRKDQETRPDTPYQNEWWEEMMARINWGRTNLGSDIYSSRPDIRWLPVIKLGLGFNQIIYERPCWKPREVMSLLRKREGLTTDEAGNIKLIQGTILPTTYNRIGSPWPIMSCDVYVLSWGGTTPDVACEAGMYTSYPDRIIPWEGDVIPKLTGSTFAGLSKLVVGELQQKPEKFTLFPELEKVIKAVVLGSVMPPSVNESGEFQVWLSVATWISQFSDSALTQDSIKVDVVVYDASAELVGEAEETILGLKQLLDSSVANGKVRNKLPVCVYFGIRLERGTYDVTISLSGDGERNLGVYDLNLEVPPRSTSNLSLPDSSNWGTSDVLFGIKGTALLSGQGIKLGNGEYFPNTPSSVFSRDDSLPICMEVIVPPLTNYHIEVVPVPLLKDQLFWQTSQTSSNSEEALFSESYQSTTGREVFKANLDLSTLKKGRYGLVIHVSDPKRDHWKTAENPRGISWRIFEIN